MVWEQNSPASIHLWELLKVGIEAGITMRLAVPGYMDPQPSEMIVRHVPFNSWGRLMWEQKVLPDLVRKTGANLLHSVTGSLPLACPVPCIFSPVGARTTNGSGLMADIQDSLGRGGYSRTRALLWPEDLPDPGGTVPVVPMPPHVHPLFSATLFRLHYELPETYIFCPGPLNKAEQEKLAATWQWISAGLGEDWGLVIDGSFPQQAKRIREQSGSAAPVLAVQEVLPGTRAGLMQKAAVVLLVGRPTSWGDPLLQSLACGRPIAAEETEWNALRAGPAAYLTPPDDSRMLGAAVITLAIEEPVAEGLSQAALKRAETLRAKSFAARLVAVYREVLA